MALTLRQHATTVATLNARANAAKPPIPSRPAEHPDHEADEHRHPGPDISPPGSGTALGALQAGVPLVAMLT